ncbi:hypothetical protein V6U77_15705 [Micromonospora sp. CPCC 205546]|uniref:hypothetical protein n=1 Tax=Micromonospora sp. CPCC 205546 TaxID=3122397 RepID=UPI002FF11BDC
MIDDEGRTRHGAVVTRRSHPQRGLDYYLLLARARSAPADPTRTRGEHPAAPEGILVEEFVRDHEFVTVGLFAAAWRADDPRWLSCASLSRVMRTDPVSLTRVVPSDRSGAEIAYQQLGGGRLPDEAALRSSFLDYETLATAPLLRLGPADTPAGFREKRTYRVLFAKDLQVEQVEALRGRWNPPPGGQGGRGPIPQMPAGHRRAGDDLFSWTLHRIGGGLAWGLDVTALLATELDDTVGPVLDDLTQTVRQHGLIPVVTERFS